MGYQEKVQAWEGHKEEMKRKIQQGEVTYEDLVKDTKGDEDAEEAKEDDNEEEVATETGKASRREQLQAMKTGRLRRHAATIGVDEAALEALRVGNDVMVVKSLGSEEEGKPVLLR